MTREAKKRSTQASRHHSNAGSSLPGWIWGIAGLSAGLLVALGVYLQQPVPHGAAAVNRLFQPQTNGATASTSKPPDQSAPNNKPTQPRFEFYQLLPDQKVEIPTPAPTVALPSVKQPSVDNDANAEHSRPQTTEAAPQNTQQVPDTQQALNIQQSGIAYLLQVGSFRHLGDADQLKAKLALLGVEASIQNVELARGETWHRVRVGPFNNRQHLSKIRKRLQENKIHTIVLKRDG